MTIDQIIFLRICLDCGIEPADLKYNSGLFQYKAEMETI
jgi:hypothetical protein